MKNNPVLTALLNQKPRPEGSYCFICGDRVRQIACKEGEMFICLANPEHQSPRAFIFDRKIKFRVNDGELLHGTVGAIISRRVENERFFLLFLRRKFPFLYTIPAGHIESGINMKDNIAREVIEETGLQIGQITPLWPTESFHIEDPCRRGANIHSWHMFDLQTTGEPRLSNEGRIIGWYHADEIKEMIDDNKLTPPSAMFLTRYLGEKA